MNLWESHSSFWRAYGLIYIAQVTSLHYDVMKPIVSCRGSKFFPQNFQTSWMFLSPQLLYF